MSGSNGWWPSDELKKGGAILGASETDTPISEEFKITAGGSMNLRIAVEATSITGTLTLKLQDSVGGSSGWRNLKTFTISGSGAANRAYLSLNIEVAADQTYLPLLSKARVVASTGVGEALNVAFVRVLQAK